MRFLIIQTSLQLSVLLYNYLFFHIFFFGLKFFLWFFFSPHNFKVIKRSKTNNFRFISKTSIINRKGTSVLSPIFPLLAVVLSAFIISQKSVDHVFEKYPSLYIITFGMVAAKVTNKLVVSIPIESMSSLTLFLRSLIPFIYFFPFQIAHMTKSEMGYSDYGYIGPFLLFLNQYFNNFLPEIYVLYIALLWCTYDLLVYCSQVSFHCEKWNEKEIIIINVFVLQVCLEICNHLEIELFRIPYPPRPLQQHQNKLSSTLSNSSYSGGLNHDRNGAKANNNRMSSQAEQDDQTLLTKRQTRSSKRHVVSHWIEISTNIKNK